MKANELLLLFLFLPAALFAQAPKGATPLPAATAAATVTRAVVVGISDYQSKDIPDLRFADRDAEDFAAWLRSPAGGNLPAENIQLLTNKTATQGKMVAALDWLTAETQAGELALIYFSGHGDVEVKTANQLGFLLCADAPPASYKAGGAYPLFFLQDNVATIAGNGGRVLLVLDACHAGKLAGSQVGGTAATAIALTRQFANEVKIMSCQPNELSLEGEQWGGGRGVFSFNLVEGLTGLADKNADGAVNLLEIGRYLEEVVPAETAPLSQIPMTIGERNTTLAWVDPPALAALKKEKESRPLAMTRLGGKGTDFAALAEEDTTARRLYRNFQVALDSGQLIQPAGSCAWDVFQSFSQNDELRPLRELMRRNLAAALQDEVQQALNALLESDPAEVDQWRNNPKKYAEYPNYLERAIALLGEKHYMFKTLTAKKLYFEAYNLNRSLDNVSNGAFRDSVKQTAKQKLFTALAYEPDAAYIYHAIGYLYYMHNPYRTDSVRLYLNRAMELAPNWALPYSDMSGECLWVSVEMEESERFLKKFLAIKPGSYVALERYALTCLWLNKVEEAEAIGRRLIEMRPDIAGGYDIMNLAAMQKQDYSAAFYFAKKGHEVLGKPYSWDYLEMCRTLNRTKRSREGMAMLDSALALNTSFSELWEEKALTCFEHRDYDCAREMMVHFANTIFAHQVWYDAYVNCYLGMAAFRTGDIAAAEKYLMAADEADPTPNDHDEWIFSYMALVKEKQGKLDEARHWFEKAAAYTYWRSDIPMKIESKFLYGEFLLRQNRPAEALKTFNFILENCPNDYRGWFGLALLAAKKGNKTAALDNLEKALVRFYPIPQPIFEEPLFKKIRRTKRFKALMTKHFPPGWDR